MNENTANEFYERIVAGTDYEKEITLDDGSGRPLEGVRMSPVNKRVLADVLQALPEEMFGAVEEADSPEEAEEMIEEQGGTSLSSMSSDTVDAFEKLARESLSHPELTNTQMTQIVGALDFGLLFELGGEIIDMSFSEAGAIKDFQEQT